MISKIRLKINLYPSKTNNSFFFHSKLAIKDYFIYPKIYIYQMKEILHIE